jgi:uncharacterized membrane protein YfcA
VNELILVLGGILAGIINTLAGNGSVITLSLCTEMIGLSPSVANGTNRLGILTQSISGTWNLHRHKKLNLEGTYRSIAVVSSGALLGIWIATQVSDDNFKALYPWFLVFIFLVLILKPERWLKADENINQSEKWYVYPLYFLIGIYGGFIQIGVGVFYLAVMIMLAKKPWMRANAAKIVVTGIFTAFAVFIFQAKGYFDLHTAIYLALGQTVGAWLGVKYLNQYPGAHKLSYYILICITAMTIVRQFLF